MALKRSNTRESAAMRASRRKLHHFVNNELLFIESKGKNKESNKRGRNLSHLVFSVMSAITTCFIDIFASVFLSKDGIEIMVELIAATFPHPMVITCVQLYISHVI